MRFLFVVSLAILFVGCSPNNVAVDNSLKKYFDDQKADGCFALFNNGTGQFTIYNLIRYRDSAFSPSSTFDVVNALVGLQTGIITNANMKIKDESMYEAFRSSSVNYFQEVSRRLGKDTLQHWLDTLSYGTKNITAAIDSFWLNDALKIKPDEQLGLFMKLYFNQLPFFTPNQEIVKNAMLAEDKPTYTLSYKSAVGKKKDGTPFSWVIGWIVENKHPYFFLLNMETKENPVDLNNTSLQITKAILKQLGFFEGKR